MQRRASRSEQVARNSARLMDAARKVFVRRGYHAATLDEVAAAAGFTKGAVYARFDSKADLMLALLDERIAQRIAQIESAASDAPRTPEAVAAALARQWAELTRRDQGWSLLVFEFRVHAARDRALNARFRALHARLRAAIAGVVARAGLTADVTADDVARIAIAMSNGFALERSVDGEDFPEVVYERAAVGVVRGLAS